MSCCEKAKGLSNSIMEWVKAGMPIANSVALENRKNVCISCEYYRKPICIKCGCIVAIKARLQTSRCPTGKW